MSILDDIVKVKRQEVAKMKDLEVPEPGHCRGFLFKKILKGKDRLSLIAEIKMASPSAGKICPNIEPEKILRTYEQNGADAISVVTDEKFFGGSKELFARIRKRTFLPLIRKDFVIDEKQIVESAHMGADAILLIAAILSEDELREFREKAQHLGMEALVETHTEEEVQKALNSGAKIIGVNNRDLKTFQVDVGTTLRLRSQIPDDVILVSESGIRDRYDSVKLRGKADAMLVGTAILRASDIATKVYEFKKERPLVKVCGIQDQETATACEELGVEFLGFNFVESSPRYIDPEKARKIEVEKAKTVALFKDAPLELVNEIGVNFDFVQLHGNESAEYCEQVEKPVIKSFLVGEEPYEGVIPLFDLKKGEEGVIEMGEEPEVPYFLAGGLDAENVKKVTADLMPYCVDVARGVEENGQKN
ncbi:indole-3-glycerol phosphate synthase TrpC, partial [Candidatus Peregrinibacteria bacterium]|nr:indole-3-glycerol phosphate synthase TrpC [Candidatus Peregrinibacteria bacterium]